MKTLFSCLALCLAVALTAQEWVRQHPNAIIEQMNDVEVNTSGFGLATGASSTLLRTTDFGENWEALDVDMGANPTAIAMIPGTAQGAVVWSQSRLWKTEDGGDTWVNFQPDPILSTPSVSLVMPTADLVFVSRNTLAIKSTDGGETWTDITPTADLQWESMSFIDGQHGWMGSTSGETFATTDGGANWTQVNADFTDRVYLYFIDENTGFAGIKKLFCKTTDGGQTWAVINENAFGSSIEELRPITEDWIVAAQGNRVYSTLNGGQTMTTVFPTTYTYVHTGICPLPDGQVWAAGSHGVVARSMDQGFNYVDQLGANKNRMEFIDFVDTENGWAGGSNSSVLRTTDGGQNWVDLSANQTLMETPYDGIALSADELLVCGQGGVIRTTDAGQSWTQIYESGSTRFYDMDRQGDRIFLAGYDRKMHRSLDGGESWEAIDTPSEQNIFEVDIVDETTIYAAGRNGEIIRSSDNGDTWVLLSPPVEITIGEILFLDADRGWVGIDVFHPNIYYTGDAGATWDTIPLGATIPANKIYFESDEVGFIMGGSSTSGRLLQTTDGGATWEEILFTDKTIYSFDQVIDGPLTRRWFSGVAGTIYSADFLSTHTLEALDFRPLLIYPNPTSGNIQLEIPETLAPTARLQLFTADGRLLRTQALQPQLNLSQLPAGTYYLEVMDDRTIYQAKFIKM